MHQSAVRASSAAKQIRACFRNRQTRFVHREAAFSACAIQRETDLSCHGRREKRRVDFVVAAALTQRLDSDVSSRTRSRGGFSCVRKSPLSEGSAERARLTLRRALGAQCNPVSITTNARCPQTARRFVLEQIAKLTAPPISETGYRNVRHPLGASQAADGNGRCCFGGLC